MSSLRDRAVDVLRTRIERLDDTHRPIVAFDADPRLLKFVVVMQSYTDTMMAAECGGSPVLGPSEADEIVASCRLLDDIAVEESGLVAGPAARRQHWIGMGHRRGDEWGVPSPSKAHFSDVHERSADVYSTKPFNLGLYSSSVPQQGPGMWRTYLDLFHGSDLYPLPWYLWELMASERGCPVLEITSAAEWAAFVTTYPKSNGGPIYPDWDGAARDFCGVHMTLRAIAATQGFALQTAQGRAAPSFWDIESTLWLRWCFESCRLVDVTR